jgi:butyryl-CoA dehydrogenase
MSTERDDTQAILKNQACDFMKRRMHGEIEADGKDPQSLIEAFRGMKDAGYPGILAPVAYGGEGGGLLEACIVVEEMAAGEPNLALMLAQHLACSRALILWADDERKRRYLPLLCSAEIIGGVALTEPEAGSDLSSINARLERRGDELVLNGNKCFVTNTWPGLDCLILGLFREPSGLAAVLVRSSAPGFHLAHQYLFAGWEGLPNHALVLQDCRIPRDHLVSDHLEDENLELWCDSGRILVSAIATGMSRACMDEAALYCGERRQFGRRLIEHQALLFRIADIATSLELMRTNLHLAASKMDGKLPCHAEVCMLKLLATGKLEEIASSAMEMAGAYGYTVDSRLSWLYRDAKGLQLIWGTRESMRLEIIRSLGL